MDIKEDINSNTIIVENFNIPLTSMGRSSRHKIKNGNPKLEAYPSLEQARLGWHQI